MSIQNMKNFTPTSKAVKIIEKSALRFYKNIIIAVPYCTSCVKITSKKFSLFFLHSSVAVIFFFDIKMTVCFLLQSTIKHGAFTKSIVNLIGLQYSKTAWIRLF